MLPDALFADVEPDVDEQAGDPPFIPPAPTTILLWPDEAAFAHPELFLKALPRTLRAWEDTHFLLSAATSLLHARGIEEVEQRVLELALSAFPAHVAAVRRTRNGKVSTASAAREGQPGPLSPIALELVKRAAAERVALLYLAETATALAAPLLAGGEALGAMVVEGAAQGPRLGKHHLQLFTGLAALAAPAMAAQLQD